VRRGLRAVSRAETAVLTRYDQPLGYAPLRALIARRIAEKGVVAEPDQIVLVDSATQALDLIGRFLLQPGDTVLVDDPCYFNFVGLLRALRANVVGVPLTPDGPDLAALANLLATHRPRFYLTNSALQNPTGASLSASTVHRILRLCEAHDTLIVEDEIFGDLEPESAPRLAGFDGFERVIQIGGFSKTLTAAARCGWLALRPDWVESLVDLKLALSLGNGHIAAALTHNLLTDGSYRRTLAETRRRLAGAMAQASRTLSACGLETWAEPRGGYFLWMRLGDGRDAADVARKALAQDMVLAPGVVFSPSGGWRDFLRFNTAHCAEPRVMEALRRVLG
jgi:DNA-binding transcriptional MocR family regulator